jgi:hypothetical protein
MVQAGDLRHLSITGRYAFGLACVEALCEAWAVDDPFVRGEIDAQWGAAEIRLACHWFDAHPFPRDGEAFAARLRPGRLSADRAAALFAAFRETRMVICGSCYAAADDAGSMGSILAVAGVLARWGVGLPDLARFSHAIWSGEFGSHGYGERFPRESYRTRGQRLSRTAGVFSHGTDSR